MSDKLMSPNSLNNLKQSNQEAKRLTKEALETALLFLLEDKNLEQITISELVSKAGVSRNAFYRHYRSKEEIFTKLLSRTLHKIFRGLSQFDLKGQVVQAWSYLLSEAKGHAQIFRLAFQHQFHQLMTSTVAKRFRAYQRLCQKKSSSYATSFFSNAIIAMLGKWISDGMVVSIEEMASMGLPLLPQQ